MANVAALAKRVPTQRAPTQRVPTMRAPASTVLALAALALVYAPAALGDALAYDRLAILSGQLWRLWSGHLVHFSAQHGITDAVALFLIGAVLEPLIGTRRLCLALSWGAALIALALLLGLPELAHYRGLSGLDVMMAVMALCALWQQRIFPRYWIAVLATLLVLKTGCEALGIALGGTSLPAGITVMWQAHALGAACGILEALCRAQRLRKRAELVEPLLHEQRDVVAFDRLSVPQTARQASV